MTQRVYTDNEIYQAYGCGCLALSSLASIAVIVAIAAIVWHFVSELW